MVINDNNNKKENMVNNEQENYTGEHQEESWMAKNKTPIIGLVIIACLAAFWLLSNNNKEAAAPVAAPQSTSTLGSYWNKTWQYVSNEKPTWLHLGAAALVVAVCGAGLKRSKTLKNIKIRIKQYWKNKITPQQQTPLTPQTPPPGA